MEDKSIKKQEVKLICEFAYLEKEMEKQIDWVLDMRTYLLRNQHDLKANVAALDPRRQTQRNISGRGRFINTTGASTSVGCKRIIFISRRSTVSST